MTKLKIFSAILFATLVVLSQVNLAAPIPGSVNLSPQRLISSQDGYFLNRAMNKSVGSVAEEQLEPRFKPWDYVKKGWNKVFFSKPQGASHWTPAGGPPGKRTLKDADINLGKRREDCNLAHYSKLRRFTCKVKVKVLSPFEKDRRDVLDQHQEITERSSEEVEMNERAHSTDAFSRYDPAARNDEAAALASYTGPRDVESMEPLMQVRDGCCAACCDCCGRFLWWQLKKGVKKYVVKQALNKAKEVLKLRGEDDPTEHLTASHRVAEEFSPRAEDNVEQVQERQAKISRKKTPHPWKHDRSLESSGDDKQLERRLRWAGRPSGPRNHQRALEDLDNNDANEELTSRGFKSAMLKLDDWHYNLASKFSDHEYTRWGKPHGVRKWYGKAKTKFSKPTQPSKPGKRGLYEAGMKVHEWHYKMGSKIGEPEYMKWGKPHGVKKWYGKAKKFFGRPTKRGFKSAMLKLDDWHYNWASKFGQPEYMRWGKPHGVKKWYGKAKGAFKPKGGNQVKPDLPTRGLSGVDDTNKSWFAKRVKKDDDNIEDLMRRNAFTDFIWHKPVEKLKAIGESAFHRRHGASPEEYFGSHQRAVDDNTNQDEAMMAKRLLTWADVAHHVQIPKMSVGPWDIDVTERPHTERSDEEEQQEQRDMSESSESED